MSDENQTQTTPEPAANTAALDVAADPVLEALQAELAAARDQALRTVAEMQNLRRRTEHVHVVAAEHRRRVGVLASVFE